MMMMMMMMTRMKDDRSANDHEDDINFISLQLKVDIALSLKFLFLLYQVYNPADLGADLPRTSARTFHSEISLFTWKV